MDKLVRHGFFINIELIGIEVRFKPVSPEGSESNGKGAEKRCPAINLVLHGFAS